MNKKPAPTPADFIVPLNMNGMQGRMLHVPAPKNRKREILMVYGHHSSLERWWGIVEVFNRYGAVTMPDLPGFGGMDSFYKIGKKPTLDDMADYLAAFVKMRYKRRRVTIVGMSYGFIVVTRMLQRFPELTKKVDMLISLIGFAHKDDFRFTKKRYWMYRMSAGLFSQAIPAKIFRGVALNGFMLRKAYRYMSNAKHKFDHLTPEQVKQMIEIEIGLWHADDIRSWAATTVSMLTLDNCQAQIDLPVWHVGTYNDHFFDNNLVEQHMRVIFKDFHGMTVKMPGHAPTVIADAKMAAPFMPPKLRRALAQS
jgi:pimeloyl-ACP methyl ester carboxylesterase